MGAFLSFFTSSPKTSKYSGHYSTLQIKAQTADTSRKQTIKDQKPQQF